MIVESDSCDVALGGLAFINICAILEREHNPKKYHKLAACGARALESLTAPVYYLWVSK